MSAHHAPNPSLSSNVRRQFLGRIGRRAGIHFCLRVNGPFLSSTLVPPQTTATFLMWTQTTENDDENR